jgi:energy-coupling factor transporter ATP-binding protein EcfA2
MIAAAEETHGTPSPYSPAIVASLESVRKNYGDVQALRGVEFNVHSGEVVALLGPNGTGKNTAGKLRRGMMPSNAGKLRVSGADPANPENRMRTGAREQPMRAELRKSIASSAVLIMLGVLALYGGIRLLVILVPAAVFVYYSPALFRYSTPVKAQEGVRRK